jgi:plastocyanin
MAAAYDMKTRIPMRTLARVSVLVLAVGTVLSSPTSSAFADAGEPQVHKITIKNFAFGPSQITVNTGDTIEWINEDFAPHTATANDSSFNTKRLKGGEAGRIVASSPGTITYTCKYHANMKGTIVVLDDGS